MEYEIKKMIERLGDPEEYNTDSAIPAVGEDSEESCQSTEITPEGDKVWRNLCGRLHRADGPAIEFSSGTKVWYLNGERHRKDGPAVEYVDGAVEYWINGERVDPPEDANQPTVRTNGDRVWRNSAGEYHREDGPAVERFNGDKEWYRSGKLHREDGPAVERINGNKLWCREGKLHRDGGPAVERANGTVEYWINGEQSDCLAERG